jgi:hypothetical protein
MPYDLIGIYYSSQKGEISFTLWDVYTGHRVGHHNPNVSFKDLITMSDLTSISLYPFVIDNSDKEGERNVRHRIFEVLSENFCDYQPMCTFFNGNHELPGTRILEFFSEIEMSRATTIKNRSSNGSCDNDTSKVLCDFTPHYPHLFNAMLKHQSPSMLFSSNHSDVIPRLTTLVSDLNLIIEDVERAIVSLDSVCNNSNHSSDGIIQVDWLEIIRLITEISITLKLKKRKPSFSKNSQALVTANHAIQASSFPVLKTHNIAICNYLTFQDVTIYVPNPEFSMIPDSKLDLLVDYLQAVIEEGQGFQYRELQKKIINHLAVK